MPVPDFSGCPWPIDPACLEDTWESDFTEEVQERSIALASSTLRRLCGYRVGGCPRTVRPCRKSCLGGMAIRGNGWGGFDYSYSSFSPRLWAGTWTNACGCGGSCGHTEVNTITLPGPVMSVIEVKVDGVALVEGTDYWVNDDHQLIAIGREWPTIQDLTLPPDSAGTFSVTYMDSYPVDGQGAYAAGKLAMEFAKACTNSAGKCNLPPTVTNLVRQGVSYSLVSGSFPNGETGIREVDNYIATWNPKHRMQGTQVWSP